MPLVGLHRLADGSDRKSPGLKTLQGLIWQEGFESGELHGQVYPDVPPALERWRAHGLEIYIYSSGSVLAQQLLFGSTDAGDLTPFLNGYFDTGVGAKTSAASYRAIAAAVHASNRRRLLFVSDVAAELDAARRQACKRRCACAESENQASATNRSFDHPFLRRNHLEARLPCASSCNSVGPGVRNLCNEGASTGAISGRSAAIVG